MRSIPPKRWGPYWEAGLLEISPVQKFVVTVPTDLTTPTEQILPDDKMADTEDVETSLPEMAASKSLTRQARQESEGGT